MVKGCLNILPQLRRLGGFQYEGSAPGPKFETGSTGIFEGAITAFIYTG